MENHLTFATMTAHGWRPGPGDPTLTGWLTVAGYLIAAVLCLSAARCEQRLRRATGLPLAPAFWLMLAIALLLLAINKQLDLQSALTWIGRSLAKQQGWYHRHRQIQALFVAAVATLAIATVALCLWHLRLRWRFYQLAIVGMAFLTAFIVIRAASFHHVDVLLGTRLAGLRINVLLEIGAILLLIAAATHAIFHHRRTLRRLPPNSKQSPHPQTR